MAYEALLPIIGLRLLALAAGLRHNAEIGQPGLCYSAYGHKFGINHLSRARRRSPYTATRRYVSPPARARKVGHSQTLHRPRGDNRGPAERALTRTEPAGS